MIIDKNSPIPQYFQLQTWLIEQIEKGVIKPNEKIPTEEELVQMTGLARATIRQAVQNLVNLGYLSRQRRLGTFVINREENREKQTIVGVLVPDIRSGYAPELARGAGDEAAKNKHSLILCNTDDSYVRADFHAERLIEHHVSGVIFVPTASTDDQNRTILEKFTRNNIQVVIADREIPQTQSDFVTTNNFDGGYEVTDYLIRNGHRKIAVVLSRLYNTEAKRLAGYKYALEKHGIPIDSSIVIADKTPYVEKHFRESVRTILRKAGDITAVFTGNDRIAYLFYSEAHEMGLSIPDDISLVGYDDLPFINSHPTALTTMHQPIYEMGQESMKLIMARIKGESIAPQKIVLKSHLVERSSVLQLVNQ
ncbi:MAG: GntR family transcriptional regulator [bacterium]